ncbi:MAG: DUF418 domain-containing protein [Gammaproteobacteria bacterium]|nr:DUF418 domain-containing protein [Gammaproteobacteria bacterium]
MSYTHENQRSGRIMLPDLVRAFALFGIVVVNVAYFAYPGDLTYHAGGLVSKLDEWSYFLVNTLFLAKSYTLFSFMFGVGISYQMIAAERRGISFGSSYFRRMIGLVLIGVAHVSFAFVGDVLIIYGLLGILLYLFRDSSEQRLRHTGIVLVIVQIGIVALLTLIMMAFERFDPAKYAKMIEETNLSAQETKALFSEGGFRQIMSGRWSEWVEYVLFATPMQAPGVLGFFLLGLASARSSVLTDPSAPIWVKSRRVYLPLGLVISALGAYLFALSESPLYGDAMLGTLLIFIGAPFSSIGYIGLIAKWSSGESAPLKIFFARGGTSSLTAYVMQSLILSLVFCGYGLGMFGQLSAAFCILIALATGLVTILFSSLWRTKFKRGPLEELLRRWTYLRSY